MINIFRQYLKTGKYIAKQKSTSSLVEISRLVLHRITTGYGIDHYLTYSLFNKPVDIKSWRQYLGKRQLCQLLFHYNKKENFWVLEDKLAFYDACLRLDLPNPEIVFSCNYQGSVSSIPNFTTSDFTVAFADLAPGDYIVKTCGGSYGLNLWSIEKTNDNILVHNLKRRLSPEEFAALLEQSGESYMVQKKIEVARNLSDIMPGRGCGSMRIMTFLRPDGSVTLPYCFLKLTTMSALSDNFSGNDWGNMLAIINIEDHTIQKVVAKDSSGLYNEVTHHPDTGAGLNNYPVPELQQALDLGRRCAFAFPDIPAVGWDIVVTDNGAMVLEGNPMFDPIGPQLCADSGVRDIIPKLLEPI